MERAATPDAVTGTAARAGRLGAHEGALTLSLVAGAVSPELPAGGESEARKRLSRWLRSSLEGYEDHHDDLSGDKTSRLSPYLHFGCLSPAESVARAEGKPGAAPFIRQLCWRDFHHQVLAATPTLPRADYRSRGHRRRDDPRALQAWKEGRTGVPIVDAGMRQLAREGFMHNRARLLTASYLTKDLCLDWRVGAAHFWDLLVDGDIANNAGNWQWSRAPVTTRGPTACSIRSARLTVSTRTGTTSAATFQSCRASRGPRCTAPWKLAESRRAVLDYPAAIVDPAKARGG